VDTREFIVQFNHLTLLFQQFRKGLSTDQVETKISMLHKSLVEAYSVFIKRASVHLSCVSPELDLHTSVKSSPLNHSGRTLLRCWAAFIEGLNELENEGLRPYVNRINAGFDAVFDSIGIVRFAMPLLQFRTDVGCVALQAFQDDAVRLREEITAVLLSPRGERFEGLNPVAFRKRIALTMHSISDLYDRALLHSGIPLAKLVASRTAMSSAVAAISVGLHTARQNDQNFTLLRSQIYTVNRKLMILFEKLRFPFTLSLILQDKAAALPT
jgi:hypothetical protein